MPTCGIERHLFFRPAVAVILVFAAQLTSAFVSPLPHKNVLDKTNQTLLIAVGGYSWVGPCDNVEIYSLTDYMWNYGAEAPDMRDGFGSVMSNNTIYVLGGFDGFTGKVGDNFWAYHIEQDQWQSDLPKVPTPASGNVAVELDGRIYTMGGLRAKNSLISEVRFEEENVAPQFRGRSQCHTHEFFREMFSVPPQIAAITLRTFAQVYAYNTQVRKWDTIATPNPEPTAYPCATVLQNHLYYVSAKNLFRSDDGAASWQKLAPPRVPREEAACVAVGTDGILLTGGAVDDTSVNTVELFNITMNAWKTVRSMDVARRGSSSAQIPGTSNIIVCGGDNDDRVTEDSCETYDWKNDKWSTADYSMQLPRVYFGLFATQAKV